MGPGVGKRAAMAVHPADRHPAALAGPALGRVQRGDAHRAVLRRRLLRRLEEDEEDEAEEARSFVLARRPSGAALVELAAQAEGAGHAAHLVGLVGEHEADPGAAPPGAAGAPDPVGVGVLVAGGVEVDHVGDAVDVDPAGGHVGRDQRVDVACLEARQRPFALALALVAVHRDRLDRAAAEPLGQPVGAALGAHEDQRRAALVVAQLRDQVVELLALGLDVEEAVLDVGLGGSCRAPGGGGGRRG